MTWDDHISESDPAIHVPRQEKVLKAINPAPRQLRLVPQLKLSLPSGVLPFQFTAKADWLFCEGYDAKAATCHVIFEIKNDVSEEGKISDDIWHQFWSTLVLSAFLSQYHVLGVLTDLCGGWYLGWVEKRADGGTTLCRFNSPLDKRTVAYVLKTFLSANHRALFPDPSSVPAGPALPINVGKFELPPAAFQSADPLWQLTDEMTPEERVQFLHHAVSRAIAGAMGIDESTVAIPPPFQVQPSSPYMDMYA